MRTWRGVLCFVISSPLFAQYAGPAILSRGEAPAAMAAPQISFQPFAELSAVYDTGLAGVAVTDNAGNIANAASTGLALSAGISGTHSWRHTLLGISYRANVDHYFRQTFYDGISQELLLGINHSLTRHVKLNLRQTAGQFSRSTRFADLEQTVPFDPSLSYVPTTDFFDNRTLYLTSQADVTWQKSLRLSFNMGGDAFVMRRRSNALSSATGEAARGDMQYRLSRRTTVGANYKYMRFAYNNSSGATDVHGATGTFAMRLTQRLEFSSYGGVMRAETTYLQTTPVDPVLQALLGIGGAQQRVYLVSYVPDVEARFSYKMPRGLFYVSGGHGVSTGNGLFQTSYATKLLGGYSYLGLRRWSMSAHGSYNRSRSVSNFQGVYRDASEGVSISRQLRYSAHFVAQYQVRHYMSSDFVRYNRTVNELRIGIGFTPSEVPLRIW